jgi:hypothetical protein
MIGVRWDPSAQDYTITGCSPQASSMKVNNPPPRAEEHREHHIQIGLNLDRIGPAR